MSGAIGCVSAIVLASGLSRRMGRNKLLLDFHGKSVLMHTLDLIDGHAFKEKIIVSTAQTADKIILPGSFKLILNQNPEKGQSESLRLGVSEARGDYYMFFLGDMPLLNADIVSALINEIEGNKIIIPEAAGAPANPVIFPDIYRVELLSVQGDVGGRQVFSAHPSNCKRVPISNITALSDIDTPGDYRRLSSN